MIEQRSSWDVSSLASVEVMWSVQCVKESSFRVQHSLSLWIPIGTESFFFFFFFFINLLKMNGRVQLTSRAIRKHCETRATND